MSVKECVREEEGPRPNSRQIAYRQKTAEHCPGGLQSEGGAPPRAEQALDVVYEPPNERGDASSNHRAGEGGQKGVGVGDRVGPGTYVRG